MQKIKTGTVTFHASHNYGSMLQAYALQQTLYSLGVDNEIINLRTERQKNFYPKPKYLDTSSAKKIIKSILMLPYSGMLIRKYNLFEDFISENLNVSKEFSELTPDIEASLSKYDFLIAGSDQIWNTSCYDFDWLYYLPNANNNAIAYAPSMGPFANEQVSKDNHPKIASCLKNFVGISVREEGTAEMVNEISGLKPDILVDPTMLLTKCEWEKNISDTPLIKEKYIFLYSPGLSDKILKVGKKLSKLLGISVVMSNFSISYTILTSGFKKVLACGPWEFLNLIKHSSIVLSGSFHAVVFSILLQRPFFALDGDKDNRICHILNKMNLQDRVVHEDDVKNVISYAYYIDFTQSVAVLNEEKTKSVEFLKKHLINNKI